MVLPSIFGNAFKAQVEVSKNNFLYIDGRKDNNWYARFQVEIEFNHTNHNTMKYLNNKWIFLVLGLLAGTLIGVKCFQKSSPDALNNAISEVSTSASSQENTQQDIEALTEENTVIAYIKEHHELPAYYITKSEAKIRVESFLW